MILLIPRLEDGFFDLEFLENYYAENDLNEDETSDDDNYDDDEHWLETEIDYEVKWLMGIERYTCTTIFILFDVFIQDILFIYLF